MFPVPQICLIWSSQDVMNHRNDFHLTPEGTDWAGLNESEEAALWSVVTSVGRGFTHADVRIPPSCGLEQVA